MENPEGMRIHRAAGEDVSSLSFQQKGDAEPPQDTSGSDEILLDHNKNDEDRSDLTTKQQHSFFHQWSATLTTIAVVTPPILLIVSLVIAGGWPGQASQNCYEDYLTEADCLCERPRGTSPATTRVAQPINTLSNLAYTTVGLIMAYVIDTRSLPSASWWQEHENYMTNPGHKLIPTTFACVVALLGPASAFLHASLTVWGRHADMIGMYCLSSYMLVYGFLRYFSLSKFVACFLYCTLVSILSVWTVLWSSVAQTRAIFAISTYSSVLLEIIIRCCVCNPTVKNTSFCCGGKCDNEKKRNCGKGRAVRVLEATRIRQQLRRWQQQQRQHPH